LSPAQKDWYTEYLGGGVSHEKALEAASKRESSTLSDALKYEGDTMGHCVGGYCPDVMEGKSRIFSLRSGKGEPHVTIEVQPSSAFSKLRDDGTPFDPNIVQIKGKANRAPNPEYLPFVQDFVKSGKWGDVGDLQNTGLIGVDPASDLAAAFQKAGKTAPAHVTQDELTNLLKWNRGEGDLPEGFAAGGLASAPVQGYNPARVQEIADALRAELFN